MAANVLAHGVGALNIDGCRIAAEKSTGWGGGTWDATNSGLCKPGTARPVQGRWPANVLHDGSDEVKAMFASYGERGAAAPASGPSLRGLNTSVARGKYSGLIGDPAFHADSGTASRFFYSAKAGAKTAPGPSTRPSSPTA